MSEGHSVDPVPSFPSADSAVASIVQNAVEAVAERSKEEIEQLREVIANLQHDYDQLQALFETHRDVIEFAQELYAPDKDGRNFVMVHVRNKKARAVINAVADWYVKHHKDQRITDPESHSIRARVVMLDALYFALVLKGAEFASLAKNGYLRQHNDFGETG